MTTGPAVPIVERADPAAPEAPTHPDMPSTGRRASPGDRPTEEGSPHREIDRTIHAAEVVTRCFDR